MKDIETLIKENKILREKLIKKSEKLKKSNERIKYLLLFNKREDLFNYIRDINYKILKMITNHIDYNMYKVAYKYMGKVYTAENVESYGLKWMQEGLSIHISRKNGFIVRTYEFEIISAKKME